MRRTQIRRAEWSIYLDRILENFPPAIPLLFILLLTVKLLIVLMVSEAVSDTFIDDLEEISICLELKEHHSLSSVSFAEAKLLYAVDQTPLVSLSPISIQICPVPFFCFSSE